MPAFEEEAESRGQEAEAHRDEAELQLEQAELPALEAERRLERTAELQEVVWRHDLEDRELLHQQLRAQPLNH